MPNCFLQQKVTKGARHKIVISIQKLKERQNLLRSLEKVRRTTCCIQSTSKLVCGVGVMYLRWQLREHLIQERDFWAPNLNQSASPTPALFHSAFRARQWRSRARHNFLRQLNSGLTFPLMISSMTNHFKSMLLCIWRAWETRHLLLGILSSHRLVYCFEVCSVGGRLIWRVWT